MQINKLLCKTLNKYEHVHSGIRIKEPCQDILETNQEIDWMAVLSNIYSSTNDTKHRRFQYT